MAGSVPSRIGWCVGSLSVAAVAALMLVPRPCAAGSITAISWDGTPPGTLADLSGQTTFMFGAPAFSSGVYSVTWLGGVTAWRDLTTIGAGDQVLFRPGPVDSGTTRTIIMTDPWTLWGTTPDLWRAESTGPQWAFATVASSTWMWGLEDIQMGRCDCDYQDAYGTLTRLGDVIPPPASPPPPTPTPPPPTDVRDTSVIPEPATIGLVALGLAGLVSRRRGAFPA